MTDAERAESAKDREELLACEAQTKAAKERLLAFARRTKEWEAYELALTMDMALLRSRYLREWLQQREDSDG